MKPVFVVFVCIAIVALLIDSSNAEEEAAPGKNMKAGTFDIKHGNAGDHTKDIKMPGKGPGGKKDEKKDEETSE